MMCCGVAGKRKEGRGHGRGRGERGGDFLFGVVFNYSFGGKEAH